MTNETRTEIAENLTEKINSEISYASGRFTARTWSKGDHVRIYWCNGYAIVNADGSIDTTPLKRAQKIDMDEMLGVA